MDKAKTIIVYSDYKSPYAFLAKDLICELEDQFDVHLEWLPYTLDIPSYLGSARLDERGEVIDCLRLFSSCSIATVSTIIARSTFLSFPSMYAPRATRTGRGNSGSSNLGSVQGLIEISDDIIDMLDTNR